MTVGAVVNAIVILRHLAGASPQGVNAIARTLCMSQSTCFNILKTLAGEGFVEFDPLSKKYTLGPEPHRLFGSAAGPPLWLDWAEHRLAATARAHSVTCGLWSLNGDRVVLLKVAQSPTRTNIHLQEGQRLPTYLGAMGRCVAAAEGLSVEEAQKKIAGLRWQDPPNAQTYWNEAQEAMQRGWSIDEGRYLKGVTTIAATVMDPKNTIRYCITSTMFTGQHEAPMVDEIGASTATLAREVSERLSEHLTTQTR